MCRYGRTRGRDRRRALAPLAILLTAALAAAATPGVLGQTAAPVPPAPSPAGPEVPEVAPPVVPPNRDSTGPSIPAATPAVESRLSDPGPGAVAGSGSEAVGSLDPAVQVVRFQGPPGLMVEVLSPEVTPVPVGDGEGIATVGLRRGVGYRLRLSNITERPGAELFPVLEVVGHLHRPREVDPGRYPIRIVFTDEDLWAATDQKQLVTKVIYLEDPDQALPLKLAKDQIPVVTLNPSEHPLRVAAALGRVMAIVRIGARQPTLEELHGGPAGDAGLDAVLAMGAVRCPFSGPEGNPCSLPCGPVCGTPPPAGRPWLPRDEYLCDGGDRGQLAGVGGDGNLKGIDPRDAVLRFDLGRGDQREPRVLPTNRVCVYAPRFAEVQVRTGVDLAIEAHGPAVQRSRELFALAENRTPPRRLVQKEAPELARQRARAQGLQGRSYPGETSELRGPTAYHNVQHAKIDSQEQAAEVARNRLRPKLVHDRLRLDGIKTAEAPVTARHVEGPGQTVMSWQPLEITGVETPPDRPGVAVIKRVSATEAEPGDTLTFEITYRNMGNTPIRSVLIVDSLLPRLEYVPGSAHGPAGTVFTALENAAGSSELRWEIPGIVPPGGSGRVSFQAVVR